MLVERCAASRAQAGEGVLEARWLGRVPYAAALAMQDALVAARLAHTVPDTLLLLEHPPTITLGRRGSRTDVYLSDEELARRGIAVHQATRGGLVTYHGPGQLVGYPIVGVRARGLTVPCYVRALERAIVAALGALGIAARIKEEHVGVWTDQGKIAAVGVAQRHGVALHGFAVNLQPDLEHFSLINPCGIGHLGVTSARDLLGRDVPLEEFGASVADAVARELGLSLAWADSEPRAADDLPGSGQRQGRHHDLHGVAG